MNTHRPLQRFMLPLAILVATFAAGCSSKDSATAPPVVTGLTFDFSFPTAGQSVQQTFTTAGTFGYRCIAHATTNNMVGTVIVDASATTDSAFVEVGFNNTFSFVPATVTILPGGHVRWQRPVGNTTATHTVTRP